MAMAAVLIRSELVASGFEPAFKADALCQRARRTDRFSTCVFVKV